MNNKEHLLGECKDLYDLFINNLSPQENQRRNIHLLEAIYTALLIRLYDILKLLKEQRTLIAFSDNVDMDTENGIKDIIDLVRVHRNAACHTESGCKNFNDTELIFSFNIVHGRNPKTIKIGSEFLGNDYQDDVAIYYGNWRIYSKRHIGRLLENIQKFIFEVGLDMGVT